MSIKIACLSDTHGVLDQRFISFFQACDEIWHAGDIGNIGVAENLEKIKPLRAVHGNIDGPDIRRRFPGHQRFEAEGLDVWITHIGGYPGKYDSAVKKKIIKSPPGLFICGHSHILKVVNDRKLGLLHINPGAAGRSGMHKVQTAVRFEISNKILRDIEILELQKKIY
jgi:uncharacterized protein